MGSIVTKGEGLWGVDPVCPVCEDASEMIEHLFFGCHRVKHRWEKLRHDTRSTSMDFGGSASLRDVMLLAIARQRHCPTLFVLFAENIALIWSKRNVVVLGINGQWRPLP